MMTERMKKFSKEATPDSILRDCNTFGCKVEEDIGFIDCIPKEKEPIREITFRGKRKDNGEWVYGDLVTMNASSFGGGVAICDGTLYHQVIPETVQQFTGKLDKRGIKIFGGDIVTHKFKRAWQTKIHISEITWNTKWMCYYLCDGVSKYRMRSDIEYEVIGNIFDKYKTLNTKL